MKTTFCLCAALLLSLAGSMRAQSPTIIDSFPYTIAASGDYILGANYNYNAATGVIITINASNVVLDFDSHYISGPVGNADQKVVGVYAEERSNLTIKNGTIAWCERAIFITGNGSATTNNKGHRLERLRVTNNYLAGIAVDEALTSLIQGCQITTTGGSTDGGNLDCYGIITYGGSPKITNNQVSGVKGTGSAGGHGIFIQKGLKSFVVGNKVDSCDYGVELLNFNNTVGGKYQDNLTADISKTAYSGGVDAGAIFNWLQPMKIFSLPGISAAIVLLAAASAQSAPTVITSAPYAITVSGSYILGNNLNYNASSGTIIAINASNVTLDLNNRYIAGPVGNAANTVIGIGADERSNLTIRNGTVAWCYKGVALSGNSSPTTNNKGHRLENLRVTNNYLFGISLAGSLTFLVQDCQVTSTGGSTVMPTNSDGAGIYTVGGSGAITNNQVSTVTKRGAGVAYGIVCNPSQRTFVVGNSIDSCERALTMGLSEGKYQSNLTNNVATTFSGGNNAGGNL